MFFSSNLKDYKNNGPIAIQVLSLRDDTQAGEEEFRCESSKILKQSGDEIYFEIDQSLPLGSNIVIRTDLESPDLKTMDEVYRVHRGRVRSCVEVESSHGTRFEVCVQIFETVIQTEIVTSRLSPN